MTIGIYLLSFQNNNKVYIGQSIDIERRFKQHLRELIADKHANYRLQEYFNMYGIPDLNILEVCSIEELFYKEQIWTEEFDSVNNGLNIIEAGICGNGVNSNNSKYSKVQILKVFIMLYKYNATRKQISDRVKVKEALVKGIAGGRSHLWLKEKYPIQYNIMRNSGVKIKGAVGKNINKFGHTTNYPKLVDSYGNVYTIEPNLVDWIENNIDFDNKLSAMANLSSILKHRKSGKLQSYKGYRIYSE